MFCSETRAVKLSPTTPCDAWLQAARGQELGPLAWFSEPWGGLVSRGCVRPAEGAATLASSSWWRRRGPTHARLCPHGDSESGRCLGCTDLPWTPGVCFLLPRQLPWQSPGFSSLPDVSSGPSSLEKKGEWSPQGILGPLVASAQGPWVGTMGRRLWAGEGTPRVWGGLCWGGS